MGKFEGAGGTPGGVPEFLVGSVMAGWGAYLVMSRVYVNSHWYLPWFGQHGTFGTVFSVFLLGIFVLFINGESWLGRGLTVLGLCLMAFGVVNSLNIHFASTSLMNTLLMFGMIAGGLGMIVRSLRPR